MTLREYFTALKKFIKENPEALDMPVIYSHDDEGNEYQKVHYTPSFAEVENPDDDRYLEMVYRENDDLGEPNCVMIN